MRRLTAFILSFLLLGGLFSSAVFAEQGKNDGDISVANIAVPESGNIVISADKAVLGGGASSDIRNGILYRENTKGFVSFNFTVETEGEYRPVFNYLALPGVGNDIELALQIDGKYPSEEFGSFLLKRIWKNKSDEIYTDGDGNDYVPEQTEASVWQTDGVWDSNGFITEPLSVHLTAGTHTLTLFAKAEPFALKSIILVKPENVLPYSEQSKLYSKNGYKAYSGKEIVIEGESAVYKSTKSMAPLSTRADPSVKPSDPYISKLNYIGGSNWASNGDTLYWEVEVPESALYKVGFHFHQTFVQEGASYRSLKIDGVSPFEEAQSIAFGYKNGWQLNTLSNESGDMLLYLTKGVHTLSMRVTLGNLSEIAGKIQTAVSEIGRLYRQIVMITGENPDANRDYNLFSAIPDLESRLKKISGDLKTYADEVEAVYGMKGGSSSQVLKKTARTIDAMLKTKYKAQNRKNALYDNYASLSSWIYEMQSMPLDLDCIILAPPDSGYERDSAGFFSKFVHSAKRLVASFTSDYEISSDEDELVVWTGWGRDQVNALRNLIDNDFTRKTGIKVEFKITEASLIQAKLSGKAPDVQIALGRSIPVDYGMRGVLYDLTQFDDYKQVLERFQRNAAVPYYYNGALYGLPETQSFPMMFVRTDILDELGLQIPETWDELLLTAKILAMNNMQVGLSEQIALGELTSVLSMFTVQNNFSFYNSDYSAGTFSTPEMQQIVSYWTSFYTKHNFPKTYSFYNRFKIGLVPIAIRDYSQYATITAAAPEIRGKWKMVTVPGTVQQDGSVNKTVCGGGTAAAVLSSTDMPDEAWEFLKWWTSEDIQYRYASAVESVLGVSARVATANNAARLRLGYDGDTVEMLKAQLDSVEEMPVIPGSYYTDRVVLQVFSNIVNGGQNVKQMLDKWGAELDGEIKRKTEEYAALR